MLRTGLASALVLTVCLLAIRPAAAVESLKNGAKLIDYGTTSYNLNRLTNAPGQA